jgi:hypothetical protein
MQNKIIISLADASFQIVTGIKHLEIMIKNQNYIKEEYREYRRRITSGNADY